MGIHQLSKVLAENCPNAVKTSEIKTYSGTKIAIDASMCLYQFLIAIRLEGNTLTDDSNETTSHLMGIFYRTLRMIDNGIKPVYVFDGKPPTLKSDELIKRSERREEAEKQLEVAQKEDDVENIDKFSKRLVKVLPKHNEECKKLLSLMGIPFITAPCEAEAQCAAMVKADKVYGVGTEDMDALTFGGNVLLRRLTFSEAKKMPVQEYHLNKILSEMELTMDQFIDLCILLGCDYCPSIRGIGPKKAVELIKKHGSIENIIEAIDGTKYVIPENWNYKGARELFRSPEVTDPSTIDLKWEKPDEEAIIQFMCHEKNFNEERIRNGVHRLIKARSTKVNSRIDSFFKVAEKPASDNQSNKKRAAKVEQKPAAKKSKTISKGK